MFFYNTIFINNLSKEWIEQNRETWHLYKQNQNLHIYQNLGTYINKNYGNPIFKMTSNSKQNRQNPEHKITKTSFPKEQVENADFYEPRIEKNYGSS